LSKGSNRRPGEGFEDKFAAIFGDKPIQRGSYVQDPETGKLVPRGTFQRQDTNAPAVHGDIQDFVSPITREVITDRAQLRRHNEQHGVTNTADYSETFMKSRVQRRENERLGNNAQAKQERRDVIGAELHKRGY
jgi:hypothetical protein